MGFDLYQPINFYEINCDIQLPHNAGFEKMNNNNNCVITILCQLLIQHNLLYYFHLMATLAVKYLLPFIKAYKQTNYNIVILFRQTIYLYLVKAFFFTIQKIQQFKFLRFIFRLFSFFMIGFNDLD